MIEYDRIELDEGIDLNKTSNSRECWLCNLSRYVNENSKY